MSTRTRSSIIISVILLLTTKQHLVSTGLLQRTQQIMQHVMPHTSIATASRPEWTLLHEAARTNDLTALMVYLNTIDPNKKDRRGRTALYIAASQGHSTIVDQLLAHNAAVHIDTPYGSTPLHKAVAHRHTAVIKQLVAHSADSMQEDRDHISPLHIAAYQGDPTIVALLVKAQKKTIAKTSYATPLQLAIEANHSDTAQLLLSNEHSPHDDAHLLTLALAHKNVTLIKLLLTHYPTDTVQKICHDALPLVTAQVEAKPDDVTYQEIESILQHPQQLLKPLIKGAHRAER